MNEILYVLYQEVISKYLLGFARIIPEPIPVCSPPFVAKSVSEAHPLHRPLGAGFL